MQRPTVDFENTSIAYNLAKTPFNASYHPTTGPFPNRNATEFFDSPLLLWLKGDHKEHSSLTMPVNVLVLSDTIKVNSSSSCKPS